MPVPVVGMTGGIGSGKSQVAGYLEQHGIRVVDADLCARTVVEPGTEALRTIAEHFGDDILQSDGALDRGALRQCVFDDDSQRLWLEALLHPLIGREIAVSLAVAPPPYVLLMSPLLLETAQRNSCDCIVVVDVPEELQVQRARARDGASSEQIRAIMAAQMGRENRLEQADEVLRNDGTVEQLQRAVAALHERLCGWAERRSAAK